MECGGIRRRGKRRAVKSQARLGPCSQIVAPVAVNIRYDRDSHLVRRRLCDDGSDAARSNSSRNLLFGFKNGTARKPSSREVPAARQTGPDTTRTPAPQ